MTVEEDIVLGSRIESDGHHATVRYIGAVPPTKGEWLGVEWDDPSRGKHDGSHEGKHYFDTKMTVEEDIVLGSRIESDGHHATVRYIGAVPPTKGEWLGVEWDDPSRGKHDGSHEGKHYFDTKHPTSGSFIRRKKASAGVSFLAALEQRYGLIDDVDGGIEEGEMFVMGRNQQVTKVEVVGAQSVNKQQSELSKLRELAFRNMGVAGVPSGDTDLASMLPNVRLLDLSMNLLSSWRQVARITRGWTKLNTINIGANRLEIPEDTERLAESFSSVKTLLLNRMDYDWEQVLAVCSMFSSLSELHACMNVLSGIPRLNPSMQQLRVLNLETNPVKDWSDVLTLGALENLETLFLNDCGLTRVEFPDTEPTAWKPYFLTTAVRSVCLETLFLNDCGLTRVEFPDAEPTGVTCSFPKLKALHLKHNKIKEWQSVNELNKLQSLENLLFMHNPLTEPTLTVTEHTIREIIIAKIKGLKFLNRSQITQEERKGAEVDYRKYYGQAWKDAGGHQDPTQNKPSAEFIKEHPRYQELIEKYGAPEDSELKVVSSALKNRLMSIKFKCPDVEGKREFTKKLPESMTIVKVKSLAEKLYKADLDTMTLNYISDQMPGEEFELDNDQKDIGFYAIEEGDTILVRWTVS